MVAPDIPTSWVARGGSHDEVVVATEGSDRDDRQLSEGTAELCSKTARAVSE